MVRATMLRVSAGGSIIGRLDDLKCFSMTGRNSSEECVRGVVLGAKRVSLEKCVGFAVGHDQGRDPYPPVADPMGDQISVAVATVRAHPATIASSAVAPIVAEASATSGGCASVQANRRTRVGAWRSGPRRWVAPQRP
jgi:hypothetical protein